jgi:hypothetical protein
MNSQSYPVEEKEEWCKRYALLLSPLLLGGDIMLYQAVSATLKTVKNRMFISTAAFQNASSLI